MSPYERFMGGKYFGSLDALRAVSILAVIWYHASPIKIKEHWTTNSGASGVALFFVISGFLITTLLLREERVAGTISLKNFYIRRALRIFPLYYLTLLAYFLVVLWRERLPNGDLNGAGSLFISNIPYYVTYTSNWFVDQVRTADGDYRVLFKFAWSLATEEQFYLIWPPLLALLPRRAAIAALVAILAVDVGLSFGFGIMRLPQDGMERVIKIMQSPSTEILLGVLLALGLNSKAWFERLWPVLGAAWSPFVWAAIGLGVACLPVDDESAWYTAQAIVFTGLVGSFVIREDHSLAKLCRFPLLVRIGVVSYGMYLLHMLVVNAMKAIVLPKLGLDNPWIWTISSAVMSYFVAEVSYRVFESRILKLKDKFKAARPEAKPVES